MSADLAQILALLLSLPGLCLVVGLRPLPILFQVQWFLEPNNTIRVVLNNQTVAFNISDTKGRLSNCQRVPHYTSSAPWEWGVWGGGGRGYNTQKNRMFVPPAVPKLPHWKTSTLPGHRAFLISYPRRKKGLEAGLDGVGPVIEAWSGYPSALCAMNHHCCRVQGPCWLRCHLLSCLPDLPIFNSTGVLLIQNGSQVSANFDGTVTISVIALSNILHASSSLSVEYRNHTEGLLGKKQSADYTKAAAPPTGLGLPCPTRLFLSPQGHREGGCSTHCLS